MQQTYEHEIYHSETPWRTRPHNLTATTWRWRRNYGWLSVSIILFVFPAVINYVPVPKFQTAWWLISSTEDFCYDIEALRLKSLTIQHFVGLQATVGWLCVQQAVLGSGHYEFDSCLLAWEVSQNLISSTPGSAGQWVSTKKSLHIAMVQ